ncbi:hypothetical protein [Rickettsia rickettsii]|uniref:Alpha-(1,3)-fucosyltransferase FucT N-terminal domain-containing protein n=1 Tax=Rickettsia rickettsii (strain Iowa) TaxID=452659 RepID=B0BUV5_RICRO|nr:hypothetical protein [Rickettsia rickettsii]ABY73015.1 hypothetical protein RrIowa_1260 [Rickettsia rickettsii str. Iowa]APU55965.1 hypothetical protein BTU50_1260 [Rickettsia rickettsii]APU57342.1 hypothetical protein BTU51_1260 [Rickettsia rickettsii]USD85176.1 hypothetical protein NDY50_05585 [Rickettsia rickettsii]
MTLLLIVFLLKELLVIKIVIKIFFTGESVRPKLENYYISIGFDYIDHPNYIRIPLYYMYCTNDIST